jgi:hypothetical protein
VHVKSEQSHRVKALLGSRDQLVRAKRALGNQVRGVLRPFGIRLPSRQGTKKFSTAAHQAVRHDAMFNASVTALLEALAAIEAQIARLDQQLKELARRSQQAGIEWPSTDRVLLSYRSATTVSVNRLGSRRNNSLADTFAMPDQLPRAGQKTFCDLPSIWLLVRCRESEEIILFGTIGPAGARTRGRTKSNKLATHGDWTKRTDGHTPYRRVCPSEVPSIVFVLQKPLTPPGLPLLVFFPPRPSGG